MPGLRSSRSGARRKRYTVDAFEGIESLIQDDDRAAQARSIDDSISKLATTRERHSGYRSPEEQAKANPEDVDALIPDLVTDASDKNSEAQDAESEYQAGSDFSDQDAVDSHEAEDAGDDGNSSSADETKPSKRNAPRQSALKTTLSKRQKQPTLEVAVEPDSRIYTRGMPRAGARPGNGMQNRFMYFYGPSREDRLLALQTRRKYFNEPCLPSRRASRDGLGGFLLSPIWEQERKNAGVHWKWYDQDGGEAAFNQNQVFKSLDKDEVSNYLPAISVGRPFVMGPFGQKRLYRLEIGQSLSLTAAFPTEQQSRTLPAYKPGFILNLGARVRNLEWLPNQSGSKQYLAVTLLSQRKRETECAFHLDAFTPQASVKSSIQIWEFTANADNLVDSGVAPVRRLTICTDFGDIKTLKWCPVPCTAERRLGLLACITGDGFLRVYTIPRPTSESATNGLSVGKAAFEVMPPNTVFTCVTWVSSSRVVAGCANGCIAIWDLPQALKSQGKRPRPITYVSISTSYILSVLACYPTLPHMILTTSMQGYVCLTDLRDANLTSPSSTVYSQRSQHGLPLLAFNHFINAALTVDDAYTAVALPLRMFYTQYGFGRLRSHATSIASSPFHPFLLVGTTSGDVAGMNPMMRVVMGPKTELWQQKWFTHEWRRPNDEEIAAAAEAGLANADPISPKKSDLEAIGREGLSNISEGFVAEKTMLIGDANDPVLKDGIMYVSLHEEKSAISALAWNPNLHVAGWAAAGMADGLLRVEDIAS